MSNRSPRPALVWLITVVYAIVFALMAFVGGYLFSRWETLPERLKAQWRAIPPTTHVAVTIECALLVIAIVQLFRMRRSAFYFYAIAFAASVAISLPSFVTSRYRGSQFVGLFVQLLVCLYIWRLLRANRLS